VLSGSVVYKPVPDNTTVLGNPARKVNVEMPKKSEPSVDKD
jgi:serine acetyltransferase